MMLLFSQEGMEKKKKCVVVPHHSSVPEEVLQKLYKGTFVVHLQCSSLYIVLDGWDNFMLYLLLLKTFLVYVAAGIATQAGEHQTVLPSRGMCYVICSCSSVSLTTHTLRR